MPAVEKGTVSLPEEHAAYIDRMVASGVYASASQVVRAGLRALQERDAAVERWLNTEVAAAYDAMKDDPSRACDIGDVFGATRARHAHRVARRD